MEAQVIQYLKENGIDCLYHIAPRKNWATIRERGLCAISFLKEQGLTPIEFPADSLDRDIRQRKGLDQYVSLSFSHRPPFLYHAQKAGYLKEFVVIKVSLDVLNSPDALVYDTNPLDESSQKGCTLEHIKTIRLDVAHSGLASKCDIFQDRKSASAEVIVRRQIPTEFFLNRDEIDLLTAEDNPTPYRLNLFIVDQSDTMMSPIIHNGVHYDSCAALAIRMVNQGITSIINPQAHSLIKGLNDFSSNQEVCVLGYGISDIVWNDNGQNGIIRSTDDIIQGKETVLDMDNDESIWIDSTTENNSILSLDKAFAKAKLLATQWLFKHPFSSIAVIHVTNGRSVKKNPKNIERAAAEVSSLSSLTLFNLQLSGNYDHEILFVNSSSVNDLDAYGSFLYRLSSKGQWVNGETEERAFAVNASLTTIISLLSDLTQ